MTSKNEKKTKCNWQAAGHQVFWKKVRKREEEERERKVMDVLDAPFYIEDSHTYTHMYAHI